MDKDYICAAIGVMDKGQLTKINGLRALIIGDSMIDTYIWGKVDRISPEAPVPVVRMLKRENRPGGAANVALNVKELGAVPLLCTVAGDDYNGRLFAGLLAEHQISDRGLITEPGRMTTVKTRAISDNHHLLRIDEEQSSPVNAVTRQKMLDYCLSVLDKKQADVIIFEDYNKGVLTPGFIARIIDSAHKTKIPVTVDPKKENFFEYRGVTLFKPNFKEFTEGLKTEWDKTDIDSIAAAAKRFLSEQKIEILLLTMAEAGIFITDQKNQYHVKASEKLEIADVSGAGDTVISVASLCLAAGFSLEDIAFIANLAGGLVCEKPGVVPVSKELLLSKI